MAYKIAGSGESGIVALEGELTAERMNELKTILIAALRAADSVLVDVRHVTGADLSCLQILCAAHRMAQQTNKNLAVRGNASGVLRQLAEEAGFTRTLGCHNEPVKSCLWAKGGGQPWAKSKRVLRARPSTL